MEKAMVILCDEHRSISAVLSGLKALAQMAHDAKARPRFEVFHAMIHYIDSFPERLHHPKEDEQLFPRVLLRDPQARALVDELRAEHVTGAKLVRDLERSLGEYEADWPGGAQGFGEAVDAYARFHWDHMRKEEHQLLPLAERSLKPEDWAAIESAFAGNEDPIADLREKDLQALFQRIVNLAPEPIGLGERWKSAR